jgi:hypothetical protein
MEFYNHCTQELSNEAKRVIDTKKWHPDYKSQLLSRVEDFMEAGQMVRTNTGFNTVPFEVDDVEKIVIIVSDRD